MTRKSLTLLAGALSAGLMATTLAPTQSLAADAKFEHASSDILKPWGRKVAHQLKSSMRYPARFETAGEYGHVDYKLIVDRSGNVVSAKLVGSSGYSRLDDAAAKTIARMSKLAPLPAQADAAGAAVNLRLAYKPLEGSFNLRRQRRSAPTDVIDLAEAPAKTGLTVALLDELPEQSR